MKTAEELFKDWSGSSYQYDALSSIEKQRWVSFAVVYNNRMLEKFKAGERFAAEIAKKGVPASTLPSGKVITYYKDKHIYEAILTDCENRTELP